MQRFLVSAAQLTKKLPSFFFMTCTVALPAVADDFPKVESKQDLGTFKSANLNSRPYVRSLSADGRVVGGQIDDNNDNRQATIWSGPQYSVKTNLGTLRADNSGTSTVESLSSSYGDFWCMGGIEVVAYPAD